MGSRADTRDGAEPGPPKCPACVHELRRRENCQQPWLGHAGALREPVQSDASRHAITKYPMCVLKSRNYTERILAVKRSASGLAAFGARAGAGQFSSSPNTAGSRRWHSAIPAETDGSLSEMFTGTRLKTGRPWESTTGSGQ